MEAGSPGLRFAHAEVPPHDTESVTGPFQIGVAFSVHRDVQFRIGTRSRSVSYAGVAVIGSSDEPIVWSQVREPTEALEIYPDISLV